MKKVYEYVTLYMNYSEDLETMLKKEGVKYKKDKYGTIVYAIDEEMPNYERIKKQSDERKEKGNTCRAGYYKYTEEELNNAKWLIMFNIKEHNEPLPRNRDKFYEEMYEKIAGCQNCNSVYIQKAPFRFGKPFGFRGYHSTRTMGLSDVFFIDDYFKECIEKSKLKGFSIDTVYSGRKKEALKNTYQFHVTSTLDIEADMKSYKDIKKCDICNKHMYIPFSNVEPNITYYNGKELDKCNLDVVYSKEYIGVSIAATFQQIIISNKMYRVLKDNDLDKDFKFDVIQLL